MLAAVVGAKQAGCRGEDVLGGVELRAAAVDVGVASDRDSDDGRGVGSGGHGTIGDRPHESFGRLEGEEQLRQVTMSSVLLYTLENVRVSFLLPPRQIVPVRHVGRLRIWEMLIYLPDPAERDKASLL